MPQRQDDMIRTRIAKSARSRLNEIAKVRDLTPSELIRRYVNAGIMRDGSRLAKAQPQTTNGESQDASAN